ncbi:hypothetical protein NA57DRAFT_45561 [Rhizodiscina lignyota]|uniref:DDHD domain-containing protein n=1 Tax=Rhizodiscina lignyota TaxID=1504668 RepID=A0A9P4I9F5_9PEZI|nr:hypothetical protein NA57DRAFT_45561 [Rhizodiscina lignyota]
MAPFNQFIRDVRQHDESPPPVVARFFFTSPYAIDDPLSPLPPPMTLNSDARAIRQAPRPFSVYDNDALEEAWTKLRREIHRVTYEGEDQARRTKVAGSGEGKSQSKQTAARDVQRTQKQDVSRYSSDGDAPSSSLPIREHSSSISGMDTTGNPFIRAPSRKNISQAQEARLESRPLAQMMDSYEWDDEFHGQEEQVTQRPSTAESVGPTEKVPVGISRLHSVVMPQLQWVFLRCLQLYKAANFLRMEPIYWSPVNDIAPVVRATWFYKDNMLPVEVEVANMLEAGYAAMRPWTETWRDELNSAVEVGAIGEMKIVHRLWPEKVTKRESRPSTSGALESGSAMGVEPDDPEKEHREILSTASAIIDSAVGEQDVDNKASGSTPFGRDGYPRKYAQAGVIYANETEAYLLRPNLQPSDYYGRKPLASYIRKGRRIGIPVVRGFNQTAWDVLHPTKKSPTAVKAQEGVSSAEAGAPQNRRQKLDPTFALSERPKVTDLILVIHGIGQKLSERIESYHFTHAMNAFRREINIELGTDAVKAHLRKDMGGVMLLPINWRLSLKFEDGGYHDGSEDSISNHYSLKDITPDTLPSVRNIVGDVLLDLPYYLSQEHNPKMVRACIQEANRIYRLWCANNPGFAEYGRVHILAHSLGSVMAFDILSNQPTHVDKSWADPSVPESDLPQDCFLFDTSTLFSAGSPVGFFLLLKRAQLLPRKHRRKPGVDEAVSSTPGVAGERGQFGCLALDNIFNVINGYDPVAYQLNAAFDVAYSKTLKPAFLPSANKSWYLANPFSRGGADTSLKPPVPRLPSNVELETHNFTREEIAEERAYLLNDNGQVDYFLRYGGGPLEIQYLTMLGAHSSYWISKDFIRFMVIEVGRERGREGTLQVMRAQKKKQAGV